MLFLFLIILLGWASFYQQQEKVELHFKTLNCKSQLTEILKLEDNRKLPPQAKEPILYMTTQAPTQAITSISGRLDSHPDTD